MRGEALTHPGESMDPLAPTPHHARQQIAEALRKERQPELLQAFVAFERHLKRQLASIGLEDVLQASDLIRISTPLLQRFVGLGQWMLDIERGEFCPCCGETSTRGRQLDIILSTLQVTQRGVDSLRQAERQEDQERTTLDSPIARIGLNLRILNGLENQGVFTVGDLLALTREEFLAIPNFAETAFCEVTACLDRAGYRSGLHRESATE